MLNEATPITILALRPGRRETGLAVLENDELVEWGILSFRQRTPATLLDQMERRLTEQIQRHQPTVWALEQPARLRLQTSPMLKAITQRIEEIAATSKIPLQTYHPKVVKRTLGGPHLKTRRRLADLVVAQYPHLAQYRTRTSEWKKSYWMPMFSAIAVALVCAQKSSSSPSIPRSAACAAPDPLPYQEAG